MKEFKGTKENLTVTPAIGTEGETLYYNVQFDGQIIATFHPNEYNGTTIEKAKANALLFKHSYTMLGALQNIADGKIRPREYESEEKIVRDLIKSATELS